MVTTTWLSNMLSAFQPGATKSQECLAGVPTMIDYLSSQIFSSLAKLSTSSKSTSVALNWSFIPLIQPPIQNNGSRKAILGPKHKPTLPKLPANIPEWLWLSISFIYPQHFNMLTRTQCQCMTLVLSLPALYVARNMRIHYFSALRSYGPIIL